MSTRTAIHAPCLSTLEYSKSHANQHRKNKKKWSSSKPLPSSRGGQHQPSPTMPPSTFPTSNPRSYPILEISQFGLILDPKLTMHLATVEAIRYASQGQALALVVSYSVRYDKLLLPTYLHTKPQSVEINSITSLSPEPGPASHSQQHRHEKNANQPQSVPGTSSTCIWRPHRTLGRHRNPSPSTHEIHSPHATTLSTHNN